MKTRDVYKVLWQSIDPVAAELGFARQRHTGTILPWTRRLDNGRHEIVYCQMDKWQWDPWMGSKFTVRLQESRNPDIGLVGGSKQAAIGDLLAGKYKRQAERIQNAAIARIHVPTAEEYNEELGAVWRLKCHRRFSQLPIAENFESRNISTVYSFSFPVRHSHIVTL